MFVTVIRRVEGAKPLSSIYECSCIHLNNPPNTDDDISFDLVGTGWAKTYELPKAETEIYVMNNDGKTIDTYRWK